MAKLRANPGRLHTTDTRRLKPPPKWRDPHYTSPEHLRWRAEVIRRSGGFCQDPMHDPSKPRTPGRLFADHIREIRDGGDKLDPRNGMARCGACHTRKTLAVRAARLGGRVEKI